MITTGKVEKRKDRKPDIPACPIMSIGHVSEFLCIQENCAWYNKNFKTCTIYLIGYNAALDIKAKQSLMK